MSQQSQNYQPVADFYTGRSVFITGATGFLGKAYVEKLAYECRGIDNIYILIRNKKGFDLERTLKDYFDEPIFARIKQERPEMMTKIIPMLGDITSPNLGLKHEDQQTLIEKVSIVIHSAASIKFNQILKDAIRIIVEGTNNVLSLSKRMKNTCIFVYVSTAYSNITEEVLEEVVYPPPADLEEVKDYAMRHYIYGDDDKDIVKLIKGHPNTYTFSKALAEQVVARDHGNLTAIIIRPSIISAAEKDPVEGWIDNLVAATGMIVSIARGWVHAILTKKDVILDLIPLDYVANLTIVAASRIPQIPGVTVYHSCTSSTNPITLINIYKHVKEYNSQPDINEDPFNVFVLFSKHKVVVSAVTWLLQTSPAFLADIWLRCKGKQPKFIKLQSKVKQGRDSLNFFTTHSWEIRCEGARSLATSLSPQDRERFRCDATLIKWPEYLFKYQMGLERYLSTKSKGTGNYNA